MSSLIAHPETDDARSQALRQMIDAQLRRVHWLPFSAYMNQVLYEPGLGYYSAKHHKIGAQGDFVTAPSLTPLFGKTVASQLAEILPHTAGSVYELGAGTGELARDLLQSCPAIERYCIIDVSTDLKAQQYALLHTLPADLFRKLDWLDRLPETFDGVIVGNELLDAIACEVVRKTETGWMQRGVALENNELAWQEKTPLANLAPYLLRLPESAFGYQTEIHPAREALVHTLSQRLQRGAMIWIDYGFDAKEYYHPQRDQGTLIGHYRHQTVHDPFWRPGLVDWTSHVDFTAIADVATAAGLEFIGYTTQAHFLMNCGILSHLQAHLLRSSERQGVAATAAVQKLLTPHEMGELFKVIAFAKNIDATWLGFSQGDLSRKL